MAYDEEIPKAYQDPTVDMSDEKLIEITTAWITESKKFHEELKKFRQLNRQYYEGNQTDRDRIPSDMSNYVQNHVFMAVETVVPIATANPPQFIVEAPEESDQSIKYAQAIQDVLGILYETMDVRTHGEAFMRNMIILRLGVWKVIWDENENDMRIKSVRPERLFFPKVAGKIPYVMEQIDMTANEIREFFGDDGFKKFLQGTGDYVDGMNYADVTGVWTFWEIHTAKVTYWKYGTTILGLQENETYDFENKKKNHFKYPKIPYILGSAFRLGDSPVGVTDLIQQGIPINDVINTTARLIINNARKMGNGTWLIDSDTMTEEEARTKITNAAGLIVWGSGVANANLVRRDAPPPLPNYIANLKIMTEQAFDNIFGTHSTTRGERGAPETAAGRMLLKQADYGRIDLLVREFERCVAELGNWVVQMMKINYDTKRTFKTYGEKGMRFITLEPHMIEEGIKILIKSGTTLPTDEISKRDEALKLWSLGGISPETMFERLKFPDPHKEAERLQAWKMNELSMQQQAVQAGGQQPQPPGIQATIPSPLGKFGQIKKKIGGK